MLLYGVGWSLNLLAAPLLVVRVVFCALGVGTLLSALTVAYRDFRYVIPFMVQFWMFATPVVYPASTRAGPLALAALSQSDGRLIDGFRSAFLARPSTFAAIRHVSCVSLVLFLLGVGLFREGRAALRRYRLSETAESESMSRQSSGSKVSARNTSSARARSERDVPRDADVELWPPRFGGCALTGDGRVRRNGFWALKDVSFEVKEGEVVGIIGRMAPASRRF